MSELANVVTENKVVSENLSTKDEILKAALFLFSRHGYKAVSVRMICEMSKANVSAISYHFGGKEELFRHCLKKNRDENEYDFDAVFKTVSSKEEALGVLREYIESIFDYTFRNFDAMRMLIKEADTDNKIAEDILLELHQKAANGLEKFLLETQGQGFIAASIDPQVIRKILYGLIVSSINSFNFDHRIGQGNFADAEYRSKLADQVMKIFSNGIVLAS